MPTEPPLADNLADHSVEHSVEPSVAHDFEEQPEALAALGYSGDTGYPGGVAT